MIQLLLSEKKILQKNGGKFFKKYYNCYSLYNRDTLMEEKGINVDSDFINKLYMAAEKNPPEYSEITLETLKNTLEDINTLISKLRLSASHSAEKFKEVKCSAGNENKHKQENVLIIDDLCIITYQLGVLFKGLGYNVTVAKDIYDAVDKFKKNHFNLVILDLFLPTEKDGFILLEELVKLKELQPQGVRIGVMTASSKEEHKNMCLEKGADFFVEKTENWQKNLVLAANVEK